MKTFSLILISFLFSGAIFSQKPDFTEYSYSEFFNMIEEEKDTIFRLEFALIKYNAKTDVDLLIKYIDVTRDSTTSILNEPRIISKYVDLNNVHFINYFERVDGVPRIMVLHNVIFEKDITIRDSYQIAFEECVFKENFSLYTGDSRLASYFDLYDESKIQLTKNRFHNLTNISVIGDTHRSSFRIGIHNNTFESANKTNSFNGTWYFLDIGNVSVGNNSFNNNGLIALAFEQLEQLNLNKNKFNSGLPAISTIEIDELIFKENLVLVPSTLRISVSNKLAIIGTNQFMKETISFDRFFEFAAPRNSNTNLNEINFLEKYEEYQLNHKIQNEDYFNAEIEGKSELYSYYKSKFNTKSANKYYSEIKTLETQRIAYEHSLNPTFSTFFKLRINQFLKAFSNYGTEPERAVIVSLYVILCFSFIYLFFPNSWDKHGKNRIINRYRFFTKYMNKESGIHEVYLEGKQNDLLEYDEFKSYMENSQKSIPRFFTATALPLYKWAVSGTKLSASLLKRVDIMKGSWSELPKKKRIWKSVLLIGAFIIAVFYDILIKMLNALMLSINTFTTLGFGEIPIKGLPRYLAIIQGFIGWFMLTIFSVSLISQLLN